MSLTARTNPFPGATVNPASNFDPRRDAEALLKAMKGLGTDEKALNEIFTHRNYEQRAQFQKVFDSEVSKKESLVQWLRNDTSGMYALLLTRLLEPYVRQDAMELRRAVDQAGEGEVDENAYIIIEILVTRSARTIFAIADEFEEMAGKKLEAEIERVCQSNNRNADFAKACQFLIENGRTADGSESQVESAIRNDLDTVESAFSDATQDDDTLISIFMSKSFVYLRGMEAEYRRTRKTSMLHLFRERLAPGPFRDFLCAVIRFATDPGAFFAEQLARITDVDVRKCSGYSKSHIELDLIRLVSTRSEIDLAWIKMRFAALYKGMTLESFVQKNASSSKDFRNLIVALCG